MCLGGELINAKSWCAREVRVTKSDRKCSEAGEQGRGQGARQAAGVRMPTPKRATRTGTEIVFLVAISILAHLAHNHS